MTGSDSADDSADNLKLVKEEARKKEEELMRIPSP